MKPIESWFSKQVEAELAGLKDVIPYSERVVDIARVGMVLGIIVILVMEVYSAILRMGVRKARKKIKIKR